MPRDQGYKNLDEARDAFSLNVSSLPHGILFPVYPTQGFLHEDDGEWIVHDEEFSSCQVLPSFIKDRKSALAFLRHSYDHLRLGIELGATAKEREISSKVASTFGLASQETVTRLKDDLEKLENFIWAQSVDYSDRLTSP